MRLERYFYDFEFLERGSKFSIQPISLGIRAQHSNWGYYAVFNDFDFRAAWEHEVKGDRWLRDNVLTQLPLHRDEQGRVWGVDPEHPSVKSTAEVRSDLESFFELGDPELHRELWGWYCDYDHVLLSQLWGAMVNLPPGMPMFSHDLKQIVELAGNPPLPAQVGPQHDALKDAEHVAEMWQRCYELGLPVTRKGGYDPSTTRAIRNNPQA